MYVAYFFILYVARGFFVKVFLMQYIGLDKNATRKDAISDGSGILPDTRLISGFERDREKRIMCSIHLFGLILNYLYLKIRFLSCRPITWCNAMKLDHIPCTSLLGTSYYHRSQNILEEKYKHSILAYQIGY